MSMDCTFVPCAPFSPARNASWTPTSMGASGKARSMSKACLSCRSKHLKCDGQTPVCSRCVASLTDCHYVQSRRGYRSARRTAVVGDEATSFLLQPSVVETQQQTSTTVPPGLSPATHTGSGSLGSSESSCNPTRAEYDDAGVNELIELFYSNVHPAHPFVAPRSVYLENRASFPAHLLNAMCFIASHHKNGPSDGLCKKVNLILDPGIAVDGFTVQALLLLTLASYARFERDLGNRALTTAFEMAIRIGLNSNSFAIGQPPVYQESWRRTWWELYTISGLISLIGGLSLGPPLPDSMALPTHCEEYAKGNVPLVRPCAEMQDRFSADDGFAWSSFAYKVEAMRILRNVLDIDTGTSTAKVHAANVSVSSFLLSIPAEKRDGLKGDGDVDEIMFCALMIIHLASICLHFPRSGLSNARCSSTVCGTARAASSPADQVSIHRKTALRSATALSNLISTRSSLKTLSPCFSCAIAYASVVQLSDCLSSKSSDSNDLKEHVHLQLVALNEIGRIWPIARVVRGQIAQLTREILNNASARDAYPEPAEGVLEADEQWFEDLIMDDYGPLPQDFVMPGIS